MPLSTLFFVIQLLILVEYSQSFIQSPILPVGTCSLKVLRLLKAVDDSSSTSSPPCPNCSLCDGSGRILGGLGAFPLTSWWPIKAYRPCPNFKGEYRRSGQSLDEIAFGREEGRLEQGRKEREDDN
ncbi:hypothetical protein TrLO_g14387 [Triparma laevis f. longispina]|uniref:Secreted protein n=1 Tax=Triparma laevis f. longispina TaxID=1714387 RepID=A0A9W7FVG2_9STRA|nr:hypothetical protein TrLO_g14387 [Triparma laevis f. longispina]